MAKIAGYVIALVVVSFIVAALAHPMFENFETASNDGVLDGGAATLAGLWNLFIVLAISIMLVAGTLYKVKRF